MKKRYSGPKSVEFWDRVNAIKNRKRWAEAYDAGVQLQNLEDRVFRVIEEAEGKR